MSPKECMIKFLVENKDSIVLDEMSFNDLIKSINETEEIKIVNAHNLYDPKFIKVDDETVECDELFEWQSILHNLYDKNKSELYWLNKDEIKSYMKNGYGIRKCVIKHKDGYVTDVICTGGIHPNVDCNTHRLCMPGKWEINKETMKCIRVNLRNPDLTSFVHERVSEILPMVHMIKNNKPK